MKLEYVTPLSDMSKAVYLANMDGTKVVVKFASKYNADAHRLLADNDLAPQLLYDGTDERRYGGLVMLVMEHIEGQTFSEYLGSQPSQEQLGAVLQLVKAAVQLLHGQNLVFGDLRTPNILVDGNGRVRFVDFDWCGIHGRDKYPFIIGNGIEWANGVGPLSTMDKAHDLYMFNNLVAHVQAGEVPGTW
jgi:serine/threonine protein kinase